MNDIDARIESIDEKLNDVVIAIMNDTILWGDAALLEDELMAEKKSLIEMKSSCKRSNRTIHIKNISKSASELQLQRAFDIFGEIEGVSIEHMRLCSSAKITFASFETAKEISIAINAGELRIPIGICDIKLC